MARTRLLALALLALAGALSVHGQNLDTVVAANENLTIWEHPKLGALQTRQIVVGDFDGDNLDDLFWDEESAGKGEYRIGVLRANGDGTFSPMWTTGGATFTWPPERVAQRWPEGPT